MDYNSQIAVEKELKPIVPMVSTAENISRLVAYEIAKTIRRKALEGKKCVLGLATGSTPIRIYLELVKLHRKENLSFKNVVTFNLDEYYSIDKKDVNSYWYFMHHHLFNHVNIPKKNINIPDGTLPFDRINRYCEEYESLIKKNGGIDIQLLGIGRTGHIGFNEPGSDLISSTRLVGLNDITREDAAPAFGGLDNVPKCAITIGISTIMSAQKIFLLAWGKAKAEVMHRALEGTVHSAIPASFLQRHNNIHVLCDQQAAARLSTVKS